MDTRSPVTELNQAKADMSMVGTSSHVEEPCPLCGKERAQEWLHAPDRFHGRRDRYVLLRCPACSLVWLSHPPKPDEMHQHYTDAYDKLISAAGANSPARWKDRRTTLDLYKRSGSILDLGCSSGLFLATLPKGSWKLYGIEMSADSAKAAEARTGAKVFVGNVLDAPFPPESFDVITCFDVLEHLHEPRRIMARVAEWLKADGIFYVQVPNIDSAEARVFGSYWHGLELPRHLFHFSPKSLEALANATGFRVLSLETKRNQAVETSLRYAFDDLVSTVGIRRTPVAYRREPSLPWRAARKVVRMTVLRGLLAFAPMVGGGEAIHAIFRRDGTVTEVGHQE